MPLFDSPPEALDKVYAEALFDLAQSDGGRERLESLSGELDELIELTRGNAELSEFLASQIIPIEQRERSLEKVFQGRVSPLLFNFMVILNRKERLSRLLPIASAFERMVQEKFGRVEVDVWTRHPLPKDQVDSLRNRLQQALGREPIVYTYTDSSMIGGIKMQVGDRMVDASVATQLRRMKETLSKDGASRLRERFGKAFEG
ncbi:MAG: ATP synthase F1 subunit delta [Phycisphaerales bacterium]|nr:ATP synthase F1 subunit delta [Phycisphaerales bacterium]